MSPQVPHGKQRTVPMECLNLGFMRTGTTSMSAALEILGIHTFHSLLFMSTNVADMDMWLEAIDAKFGEGKPFGRTEWDQLLHNFGAVSSDTPTIAFSEDLINAYPDAKVVLTYREIESWYASYKVNIIDRMFNSFNNLVADLNPSFVGKTRAVHLRTHQGWLGSYTQEDFVKNAKPAYIAHYEHVRRITPPDRLLEFNLGDGWEPLCKFLGKPIPDVPFPHKNDTDELDKIIREVMKRGLLSIGMSILTWAAPVLVAAIGLWSYEPLERVSHM